jgi:hypothetical protein
VEAKQAIEKGLTCRHRVSVGVALEGVGVDGTQQRDEEVREDWDAIWKKMG